MLNIKCLCKAWQSTYIHGMSADGVVLLLKSYEGFRMPTYHYAGPRWGLIKRNGKEHSHVGILDITQNCTCMYGDAARGISSSQKQK
jgi:hypothetical protein